MKLAFFVLTFFALLGVARAEPLSGADISAIVSDGESLFVGTFDQGLFVVQGNSVRSVDFGVNPNINALAWDGSALWVATARGVSRCQSRPDVLLCRRVGQSVSMHALFVTGGGQVVAGGERGLVVFDASGSDAREFGAKQRLPFRAVWSLAEADGVLYVGTTSGLYWAPTRARLRALVAAPPFGRASQVGGEQPEDWVTALLASRGELLVGTYKAGLATFRIDGDRLVPAPNDASLGYVNAAGIARLADGRVAVATMDGLRVGAPGSFVSVPTRGRDVTGLWPSSAPGVYWVATRRGLEQKLLEP
jgi:ligand-binding sensor domain-containing protein